MCGGRGGWGVGGGGELGVIHTPPCGSHPQPSNADDTGEKNNQFSRKFAAKCKTIMRKLAVSI